MLYGVLNHDQNNHTQKQWFVKAWSHYDGAGLTVSCGMRILTVRQSPSVVVVNLLATAEGRFYPSGKKDSCYSIQIPLKRTVTF